MEKMFSRLLIFLDSPKILLSVILFYNVLCVVFEALVQRTDGCRDGLEMSVYLVQNIKLTLESNRISSGNQPLSVSIFWLLKTLMELRYSKRFHECSE